jgi:hypothetical protein
MNRLIITTIIVTRIIIIFDGGSRRDNRRIYNDRAIKVKKNGQPSNKSANLT